MNYLKEVFRYYFKNFLYIAVFMIIPAVFIGLLLRPFALYEFLAKYPTLSLQNFGDFYLAVYGLEWLDILWIFLGFVLLVIALSLLLGFIESHFKTGKVSFKNTFSLNSNILNVSKITIMLAVIGYVVNVLLVLIMFLMHEICGTSTAGIVVSTILNYLFVLAGGWLLVRLFTLFIITGIEMLINGTPMNVSFSDTTHAVQRGAWQIFAVEAVGLGIAFVLSVGFTLLDLSWLGNILGLLILIPFECILGMVVFFDHNGIKRYDNRRYYIKD